MITLGNPRPLPAINQVEVTRVQLTNTEAIVTLRLASDGQVFRNVEIRIAGDTVERLSEDTEAGSIHERITKTRVKVTDAFNAFRGAIEAGGDSPLALAEQAFISTPLQVVPAVLNPSQV